MWDCDHADLSKQTWQKTWRLSLWQLVRQILIYATTLQLWFLTDLEMISVRLLNTVFALKVHENERKYHFCKSWPYNNGQKRRVFLWSGVIWSLFGIAFKIKLFQLARTHISYHLIAKDLFNRQHFQTARHIPTFTGCGSANSIICYLQFSLTAKLHRKCCEAVQFCPLSAAEDRN